MFLDDFLQSLRRAGVIPDGFRVNDGDGAVDADAQAVCLGSENQRFRAGEFQLLEALFQILPRFEALVLGRALGFGLVRAQKDVATVFFKTESFGGGGQFSGHILSAATRSWSFMEILYY